MDNTIPITYSDFYKEYGVLKDINELSNFHIYESKFINQKYAVINQNHLAAAYERRLYTCTFSDHLYEAKNYRDKCQNQIIALGDNGPLSDLIRSKFSYSEMKSVKDFLSAARSQFDYILAEVKKTDLFNRTTTISLAKKPDEKYQVRIQMFNELEKNKIEMPYIIHSLKDIGMDAHLKLNCAEKPNINDAISAFMILTREYGF